MISSLAPAHETPRDLYAIIGLGGNLGDRMGALTEAAWRITTIPATILKRSTVIETPPEGGIADRPFLNAAILIKTTRTAHQLIGDLLDLETAMGRVRTDARKWGNRIIDLDILLASHSPIGENGLIIDTADLTLPHPFVLDRSFALVPAAEVAAEWPHPLTGLTLKSEARAMKAAVNDVSVTELWQAARPGLYGKGASVSSSLS